MPEFVTLTCPSCGGSLNITPDVDRFACAHCGHEHVVKRGGGMISISPALDAIKTIGVGVDKTAAELALVRLDKELEQLQKDKRKLISSMQRPNLPSAHSKAFRQREAVFGIAIARIDADIARKEEEKDGYLQIVRSNRPSTH